MKIQIFLSIKLIPFKKILKCDFDDHCEITVDNRHICSYCRLAKCFTSGMKIEMIRSARTKPVGKIKPTTNSIKTIATALVQSNVPEPVRIL